MRRPWAVAQSAPLAACLVACLVAALVVASAAGVVVADDETVRGNPRLSVFAPDDVVTPGGETTLDLYVTNEGRVARGGPAAYESRVTTARGTTLDVAAGDAPVEVLTATYPAGTVAEGTSGPFAVRLRVPDDAPPGSYRLPVTLRYRHDQVIRYDDEGVDPQTSVTENRETVRTHVTVRVEDRARFRVESASAMVPAGAEGRVTLVLRNVGSAPATDAAVSVLSADSGLRVGAGERASSLAGTWEPNATRRVTVPATATNPTDARSYPVEAVVTYRDEAGVERRSNVLRASVPVVRERFRVDVDGSLRVGERGDLRGAVTYDGAAAARNATLRVETAAGEVVPVDAALPLGTLAPGDSVPVVVPVDVSPNASAGPKEFVFRVDYETAAGTRATSGPVRAVANVDPRAAALSASAAAAFVIDSDNRLTVRFDNVGGETLRDLRVELIVGDPLESDAPTGFVPELGSDESATLSFGLSVTDEAVPSTYPAELRVTYENARGDRAASEPLFVPVTVTAPPGSDAPVVAAVVALAAVVVGGLWWWRRR
jgi:hypothetical protein